MNSVALAVVALWYVQMCKLLAQQRSSNGCVTVTLVTAVVLLTPVVLVAAVSIKCIAIAKFFIVKVVTWSTTRDAT
jgi:hypothetical protein